jgi:predicted permease
VLLTNIRYAFRWLWRSPGFTAAAVLSIGLGVGANTAMFSVVDSLLLRPLPVSDPGTLVDVFTAGGDGDVHATNSFPDFQDLKTANTVFADMIGYAPMFAGLGLGERSRLVLGQVVTSNHFQVLGVQPERGRLLQPADDTPGADRAVVLSHRMWVREFAQAEDAVGRTLQLRGLPYTVVGIAPASFTGVTPLFTPELWLPALHVDEVEPAGIIDAVPGPGTTRLERRGYRWMFVKGRLKPGVDAPAAAANVQVIGAQLAASFPDTNKGRAMTAVPTRDVRLFVPESSGHLTAGSAALMAVVGLVLVIACANVTGLLLARSASRAHEFSLRAAIGASRRQLIQQLLVEGLIVGAAGVIVALAVAWLVIRALTSIELPIPDIPLDLRLDARVLIFAIGAAVTSGIVASLSPALKASSPSLVSALRGPVASGAAKGRFWAMREWLVAGQMALTIVLLVIAGLLVRSMSASRAANVGFETRGLAVVAFDTDMVRYSKERGRQFWDEALAKVRGLPGVTHATLSSPRVPFEINFQTNEYGIDDRIYASGQRGEILDTVSIAPDYFATLGVSILRGRDIGDSDRDGAPLVAVVSDAMARKFWPGAQAIGKTFSSKGSKRRYEVVGVSADYKVRSVSEAPRPYVHLAAMQQPAPYNALLARTSGSADAVLADMRRQLLAMEPRLVFVNQGTMERTFAATLLPVRIGAWLAASFSLLGTLLAATGLYGVIAFSIGRRTREIGIRLALGADRRDVLRLILKQGAMLVIAGGLSGAVLAALAAAALSSVLYGVTAVDPIVWLSAGLMLVVTAALAHLVPALRALAIDPARTLRAD